jgi:hypothetical protein
VIKTSKPFLKKKLKALIFTGNRTMKFSADKLLRSEDQGFLGKITVDQESVTQLKECRGLIRQAIINVFLQLSKSLSKNSENNWVINNDLIPFELNAVMRSLSNEQKAAIKGLEPKFRGQGSFEYKTMNKPCHNPPQQIDLDDGVYLPIEVLREAPVVSKNAFFSIIDYTLKKEAEKYGWKFRPKPTCSRVIINPTKHIDVPLYAIPKEKYIELNKHRTMKEAFSDSTVLNESHLLNSDDIYLAVRDGDHWIKSDPQLISRWFKNAASAEVHGHRLRRVCRYLKAWRDFQFKKGGPSSITLMACVVESFDNANKRFKDDSEALMHCTNQLHDMLANGVKSPIDETEPDLFPRGIDVEEQNYILKQASHLKHAIKSALLTAGTTEETNNILRELFGNRVPLKPDLIKNMASATVLTAPKRTQPDPHVPNMRAG